MIPVGYDELENLTLKNKLIKYLIDLLIQKGGFSSPIEHMYLIYSDGLL